MKLRFLILLMVLAILPPSAVSQQPTTPMSKDQIMSVVTAGIDNAELAKKIEERGIDFDLTDDYLQALRKAGAQDVVIQALRTVKPSPMSRDQLLLLVSGGVPSERAAALVKQRGLDFMPDEKLLESLRTAGADDALIAVVREAKPPEVQRHLARAAQCEQNRAWADAEKEYRAALTLVPGNAEFLQKAELAAKHQKPPQYKVFKTVDIDRRFSVSTIAITPDGRWLALGDSDGEEVWEVSTARKIPLPPPSYIPRSIAISPDGRWLARGIAGRQVVELVDLATGKLARTFHGDQSSAIGSLFFSPDGRGIFAGGDGTLAFLEIESGKEVYTLTAQTGAKADGYYGKWVMGVAFSPDGHWLASGSGNHTVTLWDRATLQQGRTLTAYKAVEGVAISPDGRWLATAGGTGGLWDLATGNAIRTLKPRTFNSPDRVTFTSDGDWLLLGRDNALSVWEVATGREMGDLAENVSSVDNFTLMEAGNPPDTLGFSVDGKWLAAADYTKVYIWQRQD